RRLYGLHTPSAARWPARIGAASGETIHLASVPLAQQVCLAAGVNEHAGPRVDDTTSRAFAFPMYERDRPVGSGLCRPDIITIAEGDVGLGIRDLCDL